MICRKYPPLFLIWRRLAKKERIQTECALAFSVVPDFTNTVLYERFFLMITAATAHTAITATPTAMYMKVMLSASEEDEDSERSLADEPLCSLPAPAVRVIISEHT